MSQLQLNNPSEHGFEERKTWFVDVIVPIRLPGTFTYRVPVDLEEHTQVGCRVIVQFGKRKVYTGIVAQVHDLPPTKYEAKYILDVIDSIPSVNPLQLQLFQWMAKYYMCTAGEVLNVALPSGLKVSSESFIQLNPTFELGVKEFTEKELQVIQTLESVDRISFDDLPDLLGIKQVHAVVKALIEKDAVLLYEQVKDKYQPLKVRKIELAQKYFEKEEWLKELFESLSKKPKQEEVLLKYLSKVKMDLTDESTSRSLVKKDLIDTGVSESSVKTLIKNEILIEYDEFISRFPQDPTSPEYNLLLSEIQQKAKSELLDEFDKHSTVLLHGITGSGKTEIYISLIQDALDSGGQVLYLLPEIALTTQIVSRLQKVFGDSMGIYHSKYSDNERVEVWKGVQSGKFSLVVGVRSSIFLPFDSLSLVIVDEEHEPSYKQYDPAPRYNARDVAVVLGNLHHAKVLFGTATPSLESFQNHVNSKYGYVQLTQRHGQAELPTFEIANMQKERKQKTCKGDFSSVLIGELEQVLEKGEQAIIFQNRRGYSPFLLCNDCSNVPHCENCSVSLTYHMYSNTLKCHYCGHQEAVPQICPACGSTGMRSVGFGTEKLEEDLNVLFPQANIQRMDQDTTRSKYSYQSIIDRFEKKQTDILIGTQMISKGLDFEHVSLVGIFDFDRMAHFPDFRSYERAFQLITQVSGRAGRNEKKGKVIIQASDVNHPLLDKIIRNDFDGFLTSEMLERERFNYPPFYRLIRIVVRHKDKAITEKAAMAYKQLIAPEIGPQRVLGPQEPLVSKIRNLFLQEIHIKVEKKGINISKLKEVLYLKSNELLREKKYSSVRVIFDVDPV